MGRSVIGYPGFFGDAGRAASRPRRGASAWGLLVLLGLAGCAGAQAPTMAEQQAGEAPRVVLAALKSCAAHAPVQVRGYLLGAKVEPS